MAKKLPLIERAKIRLGDFDYTKEMLDDMMERINAEDEERAKRAEQKAKKAPTKNASHPHYEWNGEDLRHVVAEMDIKGISGFRSDSLAKTAADRTQKLENAKNASEARRRPQNAQDVKSYQSKQKRAAKRPELAKIERLEVEGQMRLFDTKNRRGGVRPGAGRPKGNKSVLSVRVTPEEKAAIIDLIAQMRKG